jgi:hypothetical protein
VNGLSVQGAILVAATAQGVFATSDGGASWSLVPGSVMIRPIRVHMDAAGALLIGTEGYGLQRDTQWMSHLTQ